MKNYKLTDAQGNMYFMNRRKKLDRFLIDNVEDEMIYFSNNEIRLHVGKTHINLSEKEFDVYHDGGHAYHGPYDSIGEMIEGLKKAIDKYSKT